MFDGRIVITWEAFFYVVTIVFGFGLSVIPIWLWRNDKLRKRRK